MDDEVGELVTDSEGVGVGVGVGVAEATLLSVGVGVAVDWQNTQIAAQPSAAVLS
ncbi:MAG TPA: hypothetical protein VHE57_02865 [Mycobacteriales bacterium]|nr:hypothetical protein [Mycobacteriales bacterium]